MTATLDNFTLGQTLGQGFSAKVKIGIDEDGKKYALKIFDLSKDSSN